MARRDDHTDARSGQELSRRSFLKKSSIAGMMGLWGGTEILTGARGRLIGPVRPPVQDAPINCAVIGFGQWGREIADTLGRMEEAKLAAVCDTYNMMLRRAQRSVPDATRHEDYREVLDNPDIQAVFVATPTHLHRQIAIDALEAGKHVYCEAPLASTVEDARAIAEAARAHEDQIFQAGLQYRSDPQHRAIFGFIRSGATGKPVMTRAQWNAKLSWRRPSPNAERQREQNWRLDEDVTTGIMGEIGIHQVDAASWFLQERPVAVSGFGQLRFWDDGRTIPDTVQSVVEFADGTHMLYHASLASSFDGMYDMFYGSDSTIMLRDSKAWMFKEVDAPMLGWEVYARKDSFYKEKGIALIANATQLDALDQDPTYDDPNVETPLWYAIKAFVDNNNFGPYPPAADYRVGYIATVFGIKAHEAVMQNTRVALDDGLFDLG